MTMMVRKGVVMREDLTAFWGMDRNIGCIYLNMWCVYKKSSGIYMMDDEYQSKCNHGTYLSILPPQSRLRLTSPNLLTVQKKRVIGSAPSPTKLEQSNPRGTVRN